MSSLIPTGYKPHVSETEEKSFQKIVLLKLEGTPQPKEILCAMSHYCHMDPIKYHGLCIY